MTWITLTALAAPAALAGKLPLTVAGGLRNTMSTFEQGEWDPPGVGTGGQLRVQLGDRVGTEWFYDYLSDDLPGARRIDQHIGWSVLFYPRRTDGFEPLLLPYLLAGHCFDYTEISLKQRLGGEQADRWSSAVQVGAGSHLNLTRRFDLSLTGQYMVHLGNNLHPNRGELDHGHAATLEGHLLFTLSVNMRFVNQGKRRSG